MEMVLECGVGMIGAGITGMEDGVGIDGIIGAGITGMEDGVGIDGIIGAGLEDFTILTAMEINGKTTDFTETTLMEEEIQIILTEEEIPMELLETTLYRTEETILTTIKIQLIQEEAL